MNRQQEAASLRIQGHTYSEIAERMDLTIGAIKAYIHRAKRAQPSKRILPVDPKEKPFYPSIDPEKQKAIFDDFCKTGDPQHKIAERHKVSTAAVNEIINHHLNAKKNAITHNLVSRNRYSE